MLSVAWRHNMTCVACVVHCVRLLSCGTFLSNCVMSHPQNRLILIVAFMTPLDHFVMSPVLFFMLTAYFYQPYVVISDQGTPFCFGSYNVRLIMPSECWFVCRVWQTWCLWSGCRCSITKNFKFLSLVHRFQLMLKT